MGETRVFRVVVFRGRHDLVAQCLEVDLAAQGADFDELAERFANTVKAHVILSREKGVEPFSKLPQAADRYWKMWAEAGLAEAREVAQRRARESTESRWNLVLDAALDSLGLGGMRAAVAIG
jgi:hypothetical protein